jgi:pyruvate,orthophosphate dikinase
MEVAKGILTARRHDQPRGRGRRGMGTPCVAGAGAIDISEQRKEGLERPVDGKKMTLKEGDWLSLDGSTGEVFAGQANTLSADPIVRRHGTSWAGRMNSAASFGVRANADIPRDAKAARKFGAEGIGLCRTEHMFFAEDRIAAHAGHDPGARRKEPPQSAGEAAAHAAQGFRRPVQAMDGFPVVIRTLDPPLHEFLPKREDLMVDLAKLPAADLKSQEGNGRRYERLGATVKDLKKVLTGTCWSASKSCTSSTPCWAIAAAAWASLIPEITEMQARAIFEAAVQVAKKGVKVIPEVMIPLIGSVEEFDNQKAIVVRVAEKCSGRPA